MIVACVRTGNKFPVQYVYKLRDMVARHLKIPYQFICLTDMPNRLPGVKVDDIWSYHLDGWWGKMALFEPVWRTGEKVIYFDLDTIVCGDLTELAELEMNFGICANFTRAAGNKTWPCNYGSCCMILGKDFGDHVWNDFNADVQGHIQRAGGYGDQKIIEELLPAATLLQDCLPDGFFLGYRDLDYYKPRDCSVVVFAGSSKPHNCEKEWIKNEWVLS